MKLAVTAASGQLGVAIVNEAIRQLGSQNIIGIARNPEKAVHLGLEIRQGDYNNREEYQNALKGIEVVLLVSGMDAPEKRIEQHRNVINAAITAGVRKLVYTTRDELARAYLDMITRDELNGSVYNLAGETITQQELADAINLVYGSDLKFESMSVEEYRRDRTAAHGDVFGTIISGIYEGIRNGAFEIDSDYRSVTGREHISAAEYINLYKLNH